MRVDIEDLQKILDGLKLINSKPIEELEFYLKDRKIDINPEQIKEWKYIGLSNSEFIQTGYYKDSMFHTGVNRGYYE